MWCRVLRLSRVLLDLGALGGTGGASRGLGYGWETIAATPMKATTGGKARHHRACGNRRGPEPSEADVPRRESNETVIDTVGSFQVRVGGAHSPDPTARSWPGGTAPGRQRVADGSSVSSLAVRGCFGRAVTEVM